MKIKNDLVALDIETTGVWVEKDKIIELALIKYHPNGEKETFHRRINPGMLIPEVVTKLTGISDQDVKDAPYFKEVTRGILDFIGDADLAGFNIERFDLPLLEREFAEAGIHFEWKERRIYDAQKVYHLNEKRDLAAAYQFYCQKELIGAHSALADSEAVYEILKKQIVKYGEGSDELSVLEKFEYVNHTDFCDSEKRFCWWNGKVYPAFGKYRRQLPLDEIAKRDAGYLKWLLKSDFKDDAKELLQAALDGELPARK
ncbi:MAG: 3'-5' exonuclease [Candidatus Omnitrophica bacterium]|nr:3'-5' exonuclease [Candidatus Omnitrophota bacterium]